MRKILVANRGEIAVRIIRTIRDLGMQSVSIFDQNDWQSLHVRLSDECYATQSDMAKATDLEIIELAKKVKADAIHPGYGFLAEKAAFAKSCEDNGIIFIGPSSEVLTLLQDRLVVLEQVKKAGIPTPKYLNRRFVVSQVNDIISACQIIGYPLIFQACFHQPGRSIWFIDNELQATEMLARLRQKQPDLEIFLEEKISPVHLIRVPILGNSNSHPIIFTEIDSSIQYRNRRLIEESPSPIITPRLRLEIEEIIREVVCCLNFSGLGTVDLLVNGSDIIFSKVKPYLAANHVLNEVSTNLDLVATQMEYLSGLPLAIKQEDVQRSDFSLLCRVSAVDPYKNFLPSPGVIRNFRLPAGPFVRCDSHITQGYQIPEKYDPILVKISISSKNRKTLISRMQRALSETSINGITTDLPVLLYILNQPEFNLGQYHTDYLTQRFEHFENIGEEPSEDEYKNFAIATATAYYFQRKLFRPVVPERLKSTWHQDSRKL